jgi:hypothetical protein
MKKRPIAVILVSVLFVLTGCMGIAYHAKEFFDPTYTPIQLVLVLFVRVLAVLCGVFLFYGFNWARWLAIVWLLYHVVLSAFHSTSELVMHIVFLALVSVLLFIPVSNRFFQKKRRI